MAITASDVNKLRQQTGAGMMDCKKALEESEGDFEKAVDYLRKKGQKVAANRADRDAKEGLVIAKTTADHKHGTLVVVNCETDFVAKNAEFGNFANSVTLAIHTLLRHAGMGEPPQILRQLSGPDQDAYPQNFLQGNQDARNRGADLAES